MDLTESFKTLSDKAIFTIAGVGQRDGIPAKEADAGWPLGVVRRPDGDLIVVDYQWHRIYFSDTKNNRVRRLTDNNRLETVVGNGDFGDHGEGGPAGEATLNEPHGLCFYGDDILLLCDHFNNRIKAVKIND